MISQAEAKELQENLHLLSEDEQAELLAALGELESRAHAQKLRSSLIDFIQHMNPNYHVGVHHRRLGGLLEDMERGEKDRIAVSIAPRHGKKLADSTPVYTPNGWTTHGELRPGDYVYGSAGTPIKVLAVSPKGYTTVELEFSNGEKIKAHPNHEWAFIKDNQRYVVKETNEFMGEKARKLWRGTPGQRGGSTVYRLPNVGLLQGGQDSQKELDPYMLGLWVGDGTANAPLLTMSVEDAEVIREVLSDRGWEPTNVTVKEDTGVTILRYGGTKDGKRREGRQKSVLGQALYNLGIYETRNTPTELALGSLEYRLDLMAGLIDSDGSVDPKGRVRYVTTNTHVAEMVRTLAASLGFKPYTMVQEVALSTSGVQGTKDVITVGFNPTMEVPTKLPRKKIKVKTNRSIALVAVRETTPELGQCIQVDAEDGLYLAGRTMLPTHNSEMLSVMFPAWYLGNNPGKQVMLVSHTADLAVDFGRKVRNIIQSDLYQEVFPTVNLSSDSKSAGRWNTNVGGGFYATGVGSALAGRGADFMVIDDPHSEQALLAGDYSQFEKAYEWFTTGARTRLMKGGRIAILHTRWHPNDLIGKIIQDMARDPLVDQYEIFEFPAILNEGEKNEKALWPEFFNLETLKRTKASMPLYQWNAQYQQNPTGREGAIVPREKWRKWTDPVPPVCSYLIMSVDAAAETRNRSDFSVISTWGVFAHESLTHGEPHIILLNVVNERMQFPELKRKALLEYERYQPDAFIVEKKSNGVALYQEMRRMGIPVQEFNPSRATGDKVARLNSVSDIFESGMVWYPAGIRWAEELVEQVAAFPASTHDDMVDATSMALSRFRQGGFIRLPSDYEDEDSQRIVNRNYY